MVVLLPDDSISTLELSSTEVISGDISSISLDDEESSDEVFLLEGE